MANMFILVGKIADIKENGIVISVVKSYKNDEGIYESDLIYTELEKVLMDKMKEYCKVGDTVGVKGIISSENTNPILKVEKLTFLSSNKEILKKESE